ncbi:MAG: hypothetical protein ACQETW_06795 [Pseudomonadota bacterium]|jgi:hypothetical protein
MAIIRAKGSSPWLELANNRNNVGFSSEHDEAILSSNIKTQDNDIATHWPSPSWEEGDLLIYGHFTGTITFFTIGVGIVITAISVTLTSIIDQKLSIAAASLGILPLGVALSWISLRIPANRFIVFDRSNQLTYIPKKFTSRHDSIRWKDTSFFIFDENYLTRLNTYSNTNITLVPPPLDGKKGEVPGPYGIGRLIFLQGLHVRHYNSAEAEAIYRYIVAFMTQPPDKGILREIQQTEQAICNEEYDGDRDAMRRHLGWFWYRLDLEKLPNQPNWIRHPNGRWERTGPGVKVLRPWWDNLIKPRRIPKNQGTERPGT